MSQDSFRQSLHRDNKLGVQIALDRWERHANPQLRRNRRRTIAVLTLQKHSAILRSWHWRTPRLADIKVVYLGQRVEEEPGRARIQRLDRRLESC